LGGDQVPFPDHLGSVLAEQFDAKNPAEDGSDDEDFFGGMIHDQRSVVDDANFVRFARLVTPDGQTKPFLLLLRHVIEDGVEAHVVALLEPRDTEEVAPRPAEISSGQVTQKFFAKKVRHGVRCSEIHLVSSKSIV